MALVILDRDGVINFDSEDYIKSPDEWRPIPGSLEAIARLCRANFRVVLATNQSGIGRGKVEKSMRFFSAHTPPKTIAFAANQNQACCSRRVNACVCRWPASHSSGIQIPMWKPLWRSVHNPY